MFCREQKKNQGTIAMAENHEEDEHKKQVHEVSFRSDTEFFMYKEVRTVCYLLKILMEQNERRRIC